MMHEDHTTIERSDQWSIVSAYFRKYSLVRHQIEAYNHFVMTLLPRILMESAPFAIEENDQRHVIFVTNPTMRRPCIVEHDGVEYPVVPNVARSRGTTYEFHVHADVVHDIFDCENTLVERRVFRESSLCVLPCMIGSCVCNNGLSQDENYECTLDQGGYFIINGIEKVLIAQERLRTNHPFVFAIKHPRYSYQCEIRSCHESRLRSTSTLYLYIASGSRPDIVGELPFIMMKLSLATMFRLLRVRTTDEMIRLITCNGTMSTSTYQAVCSSLSRDVTCDMTDDEVLNWVMRGTSKDGVRERKSKYIEHIICNEYLPHMGVTSDAQTLQAKAAFLALMVRHIIDVNDGVVKPDDRDDYSIKRVDPCGMGLLFRQVLRSQMKAASTTLYKLREAGRLAYSDVSVVFNFKRISNTFRYAFATGAWSMTQRSATSQNTGVVQAIARMTVVATLSNCRRINTPVSREGKSPKPRQLHHTSWGIVCGVETPEGTSCGLVKNLALMTHVRVASSSENVLDALMGTCGGIIVPIEKCMWPCGESVMAVFVCGRLIGYVSTANATVIVSRMAKARCDGSIPFDTSISVSKTYCHIDSDGGCMLRPLVVGAQMHLIPELVRTHDSTVLWDALIRNGVIVYMDKMEERSATVGLWSTCTDATRYTHYELHPSLIMGLCASLIPFPEHNQAPRNTYQSAMCKQAVSIYVMNHGIRMDAMSHVLCTPQRALVTTRMDGILNLDRASTGTNVIVAIMLHNGYNQEDSIIVNEDALQRGLFRSEKYVTTREEERPNGGDHERMQKPEMETCAGVRLANYDKIGSSGTPTIGSVINTFDVIIGKTMTINGDPTDKFTGRKQSRDMSTVQRHETCVVDSIIEHRRLDHTTSVRVKTRVTRQPIVGDKFSSRMGQKGVIGRTYRQEDMPFTKDGVVPDIIVNPHAIPSRMTVGQLMECLLGKLCSVRCEIGDATAFGDVSVEGIAAELEREGYDGMGRELMYSGETGLAFEAAVFLGPTYYQRLKHMVSDKNHSRTRGPMQALTRQPLEGRAREGGLRFGEMERDCIISHGAHHLLLERLMLVSDVFCMWLCDKCGFPALPPAEGTLVRNRRPYCKRCERSSTVRPVQIPYAMKLLNQELAAMHVGMRLLKNPLQCHDSWA